MSNHDGASSDTKRALASEWMGDIIPAASDGAVCPVCGLPWLTVPPRQIGQAFLKFTSWDHDGQDQGHFKVSAEINPGLENKWAIPPSMVVGLCAEDAVKLRPSRPEEDTTFDPRTHESGSVVAVLRWNPEGKQYIATST
jgi:hypothetical protein